MTDFDIILGMDWLTTHQVVIDYKKKRVRFNPLGAKIFKFYGTSRGKIVPIISVLRAQHLLASGCLRYLVNIVDKEKETRLTPEEVPVIREYLIIFLDYLPGLPPDRQIEFSIELVLGTVPISKEPYCLAPTELKELKIQLEDLLEKGLI